MKALKYIPLFSYLLILYNVLAFIDPSDIPTVFNNVLIEVKLISGSILKLNVQDIFIIVGAHFLYIEILKSTRSSLSSIIDHVLSMVVFIVFLVEFIAVKKVGNSSFLILTLMSMLDVIAGFTVTISSSRRDISIERG